MKVRRSSDAEDDRAAIREYIAADNPRAARRVDEAMGIAAGEFPSSGHVGVLPETREVLAHKHCRLVYEAHDDAGWIIDAVHKAGQWPPAGEDA